MSEIDLAKSMIKETEHGYIGYENLHNNDDEGLELIKRLLEKEVACRECEDGDFSILTKDILAKCHGYKQYSDSYLMKMTKVELVLFIRGLEHNWATETQKCDNQYRMLCEFWDKEENMNE